MKYVKIPFNYNGHDVTFFIPMSFILYGDLAGWKMEPTNFLGVDLTVLIK